MTTEPKTGTEALEIWKKKRASYDQNPKGEVTLVEVYEAAYRTSRLAEAEGISLPKLVGDTQVSWQLLRDLMKRLLSS